MIDVKMGVRTIIRLISIVNTYQEYYAEKGKKNKIILFTYLKLIFFSDVNIADENLKK